MTNNQEKTSTPTAELIAELMNPNNPKNEREHAAVREIKRLREAIEQRTWVGLTDKDRLEFAKAQHGWEDLCLAVETKLKEKNNGAV
jgi:hypothetical protein